MSVSCLCRYPNVNGLRKFLVCIRILSGRAIWPLIKTSQDINISQVKANGQDYQRVGRFIGTIIQLSLAYTTAFAEQRTS